jgi:hypothetical protein
MYMMTDDQRYQHIARALGQKAAAEKVLHALSAEGIPVIVLKGLTLRERVYAEPHQREMGDVDFLVRKADFKKAASTIQTLGYTFSSGDKGYTPEFTELYMGEVSYQKGFVFIDLHWSLTAMGWYRRTTNFDLNQMWDAALPTKIGEAPAYRFCPVDEVIHLCYHTAVHHALAHEPGYRDIRNVIQVECDSIDWDLLIERARTWRVSTAVWSALSVLRYMEESVVPEEVLSDLGVPGWRQLLLQPIIKRLQTEKQVFAAGTMRFLGVLLVDRLRDLVPAFIQGLFPGKLWLKTRFDFSDSQAFITQFTYPFTVIWNGLKALQNLHFTHPRGKN